jgi:hypothetical protein
MKIAVIGLDGIPIGKNNVKDPRLDQADKLVEAKKKVYVQVDVVGEGEVHDADLILTSADRRPDLVLHDLEFVEVRLGREPSEAERTGLVKLQAAFEREEFANSVALTEDERKAITAHAFWTAKPVVVAQPGEVPEALLVRAYQDSGDISYLTVGGKENRAWPIRKGATAWEAAGAIHSDIQKGFIRAEIISFTDFVEAGGETQAKRAGKQRLETKQYVMQDYDVVNFRFNK